MGSDATQPFIRARIKTGFYTGNGADDRSIDIGIDLASKNNVWVIIRNATTNPPGIHRTERGQGDISDYFQSDTSVANMVQSFTNTGFQVGSDPAVNQNASAIVFIAIWSEP